VLLYLYVILYLLNICVTSCLLQPKVVGNTLMEVRGASAGDGGSYSAMLPRLVQETELQKKLADEKMRTDQHKTNYQLLKAEHTR